MDKKEKEYSVKVEMTYTTTVKVIAEDLKTAKQMAKDLAGDGVLIKQADLTEVHTE